MVNQYIGNESREHDGGPLFRASRRRTATTQLRHCLCELIPRGILWSMKVTGPQVAQESRRLRSSAIGMGSETPIGLTVTWQDVVDYTRCDQTMLSDKLITLSSWLISVKFCLPMSTLLACGMEFLYQLLWNASASIGKSIFRPSEYNAPS